MAPKRVEIDFEENHITFSLKAVVSLIASLAVFIVTGFCIWMWMLHQRTDVIPVMQAELQHIKGSVDRLENWAGTAPPDKPKPVASH